MVDVAEFGRLVVGMHPGGLARLFTYAELTEALQRDDCLAYLATRLAAKEAVFKALSAAAPGLAFDYRKVETLNRPDGAPHVAAGTEVRRAMASARVDCIHLSISTESGFAVALAVAE